MVNNVCHLGKKYVPNTYYFHTINCKNFSTSPSSSPFQLLAGYTDSAVVPDPVPHRLITTVLSGSPEVSKCPRASLLPVWSMDLQYWCVSSRSLYERQNFSPNPSPLNLNWHNVLSPGGSDALWIWEALQRKVILMFSPFTFVQNMVGMMGIWCYVYGLRDWKQTSQVLWTECLGTWVHLQIHHIGRVRASTWIFADTITIIHYK